MVDLSGLSLYAATPEQVLESRRRTFVHWGRGMNQEEYLQRDAVMDTLSHARDGKLITWVLASREDPTSTDFKCSCETFQRIGFIKPASTSVLETAVCYGIASAYTPPPNRKQGFARHMMRLLHWVLAPPESLGNFPQEWGAAPLAVSGTQNARFSVLYSDVGPDFYHECGPTLLHSRDGWEVKSSVSTTWNVQDATQRLLPPSKDENKWVMLDKAAVEELFEKDVKLMHEEMIQRPSSGRMALTFLPFEGVGAFQHHRSSFYLTGRMPPMTHFGVALSDSSGASAHAFASWTIDVGAMPDPTLIITRLRCPSALFPGLFDAVLSTARTAGMTRVEIWNIPQSLVEIAQRVGGKTAEREEHLPSVKVYGLDGEIGWMYNEKFCWC